MFTSQRPAILGNVVEESASADADAAVNYYVGRSIQIALALWLLPALIIVLAVGGIGIVALAINRMLTGPVSQPPETQQLQSVHGERPTDHGSETSAPKKPEPQVIGPIVDRAIYHKPHHA
jgi:hypothetical protein